MRNAEVNVKNMEKLLSPCVTLKEAMMNSVMVRIFKNFPRDNVPETASQRQQNKCFLVTFTENCNISGVGCSNKCYADSDTCICKNGFTGAEDCSKCADGYYGYPECKPCDMCYYNGTELINGLLSECEQLTGQNGVQKCKCKDNYDGNLCDQCKEGKNCERKSIIFLQDSLDTVHCVPIY